MKTDKEDVSAKRNEPRNNRAFIVEQSEEIRTLAECVKDADPKNFFETYLTFAAELSEIKEAISLAGKVKQEYKAAQLDSLVDEFTSTTFYEKPTSILQAYDFFRTVELLVESTLQ